MKALTYIERGRFALLDKPKPVIMDDRDAIVRVTLASICTSDLHIKHGSVPRAAMGVFLATQWQGTVATDDRRNIPNIRLTLGHPPCRLP